jgi:hypothetical protein
MQERRRLQAREARHRQETRDGAAERGELEAQLQRLQEQAQRRAEVGAQRRRRAKEERRRADAEEQAARRRAVEELAAAETALGEQLAQGEAERESAYLRLIQARGYEHLAEAHHLAAPPITMPPHDFDVGGTSAEGASGGRVDDLVAASRGNEWQLLAAAGPEGSEEVLRLHVERSRELLDRVL